MKRRVAVDVETTGPTFFVGADTIDAQLARVAKHTAAANDGRRGKVFSIRLEDAERDELARLERESHEHRPYSYQRRWSLGAFIVWAALQWRPPTVAKKAKRRRGR